MMTREEARRELVAARRAPWIVTVAAVLICAGFVIWAEERRVSLTTAIPCVGILWFAAFGLSMRSIKLAALLVGSLGDEKDATE